MANIDTLRDIVEVRLSDTLRQLASSAGVSAGSTKHERARVVVDALLEGKLPFERVLQGASANDILTMAAFADIDELGLNKSRMIEGLARWFSSTFDVTPAQESDLEDDDGKSFASSEYRQNFLQTMCFNPAEASRKPRDYQEQAVEALLPVIRRGASPKLLHVATGGGKTWIANDLLVEILRRRGGWVLWLTKDWQLLWQAARDVARRHKGYADRLRRLGGSSTPLHPMDEGADGWILYSTLQTFQQRVSARELAPRSAPTLVIWDECHWGEHGQLGRDLLAWCKRREAPLLGLTATPRPPATSIFDIAFSIDFATLVRQKHLAEPVPLAPVQTGIPWRPSRANQQSDFQLDSLRELAKNKARNQLIIKHYADNQRKYGKAIFFACNIAHADTLARQLCERAIPARSVHSQLPGPENERALEQLRRGEIQVLVNVAKLTHGVDVPDVQTVFLCRPTLSDILFSQMVGRGSRRDEASGKTRFFIVEFTDNLELFGDQLVTSRVFFEGGGIPGQRSSSSSRRRPPVYRGLTFNPAGAPTWIPESDPRPEIRGLWFRQGQTFGIEFELTRPANPPEAPNAEWLSVAEALRVALVRALGHKRVASAVYVNTDEPKDFLVWNVEWDGSCGWEVTTPILKDRDGFAEVCVACEVLLFEAKNHLGLDVNASTGTHVHIGWLGNKLGELKRAIELVRLFEPALATLVAPSRIAHFDGNYHIELPNRYCAPVSTVFSAKLLSEASSTEEIYEIAQQQDNRYVTFNVLPYGSYHTVEVRLHNGTLEASKILAWVSLWMQILHAAAQRVPIPAVPDTQVITPNGDIFELAKWYLPAALSPSLMQRLKARRKEILGRWRYYPDLHPWATEAASKGW